MTDVERAPEIRGKTIRMTWGGGPTKGETHEHVFHQDGTVEYHTVGASPKSQGAQAKPQQGQSAATAPGQTGGAPPKAEPANEKPEYAAVKVADGIFAISYLAPSGYTLTAVLNFRDKRIVGFASGAKEWFPVQGTFEVVK